MSSSVRSVVKAAIRPKLPTAWEWKDGIPTLKTLARPTVWLEYRAFNPAPAAPLSHIAATVDVCVATNLTDVHKGESAADEHVARIYEALFTEREFYDFTAEKTVFEDTYIGWRITLTVLTTNPEG